LIEDQIRNQLSDEASTVVHAETVLLLHGTTTRFELDHQRILVELLIQPRLQLVEDGDGGSDHVRRYLLVTQHGPRMTQLPAKDDGCIASMRHSCSRTTQGNPSSQWGVSNGAWAGCSRRRKSARADKKRNVCFTDPERRHFFLFSLFRIQIGVICVICGCYSAGV